VKQLEISTAAEGSDPTGEPPAEDAVGSLFGRYRLLRRIGKGGMAEAFLAVQEGPKGFRRKCVVKRIRPEKAASTYFTQMFVDEARITAALHHPNIVQVYEFGEVGDLYFLSMEYLDGRNLGALLDGLHSRGLLMPINMAAHIARQVARALHYAHTATDDEGARLGVIHRDVSPTNIMLLRTGEVKLLDFGVAKAERTLKQGATVVGKVKGKLSYMSPEQHSGKTVDLRADIFSLGVMLWEMLTGELLFAGARGGERSRKMMRGEVPVPSTLRTKVTPALDAIVLRCLRVNADERYPSAGALADALGDFVRPSLFDPTELAALVTDYPGDDRELSSGAPPSSGPAVVDSHAVLTREDAQGDQSDDLLMAATTARERLLPLLPPDPAAAPPPETSPPPISMERPGPSRRLWPVLLAGVVGVGLVLLLIPRRSPSSSFTAVSPRRGRAEILHVPSPAPGPQPPAPDPVSAPVPEARADPSAPRIARPTTSVRRRVRTEPKGDPGSGRHDLKLVNPF
jgi:serine/threonine protein kinase